MFVTEYLGIMNQFTNDTTLSNMEINTEQARSVSSFTLPESNEKCVVVVFLSEYPPAIVCNIFTTTPEVFTIDSAGAIKVL